jgi:predicted amidohydrolase YtcJ
MVRSIPLLLLLFCSLMACQEAPSADVVFWNGRIYTMENPGEQVEALAVKGERIVFTGSEKEARQWVDKSTKVIDLQGKTVLPGFTDAHTHPISGGLAQLGCDLTGIEHPDSILTFIEDFSKRHPEKSWVRAYNFWLASFPGGNPRKEWLDAIIPDRPAYVESSDGHSAWVNSKALEMAGISSETPDPPNGTIERDQISKEPTGTLREEAMYLVEDLIPPHTQEELEAGLKKGLEIANALGITNLVEASAKENYAAAYMSLAKKEALSAHVNLSIYGDVSKGQETVRKVLKLNNEYHKTLGSRPGEYTDIRLDQVKLFIDGVVEGKTAAMLEPYSDDVHAGYLNALPDSVSAVVVALDSAGLQVHVHAIGDLGIRISLDAFEEASIKNGVRDSRHHITHLHVIHPDDLDRFKELGVIANFQALWATLEDSYMTELNYPFLGEERVEWQYPIGTLARTGARLVFSSDWPVSTMDPFDAAQVAVTRRGPDSIRRPPWTPQHLIDLPSVVEGYTIGGAYLSFREKEIGTLTVGKLADLVVLDRDIFQIPEFDLYKTKVVLTLFKGKIVYSHQTEQTEN